MNATAFTWQDRPGERVLYLDDPGVHGARYLAVRQVAEADWTTACVLQAGEPEREVGDGLVEARVAEDTVLKYAIQALARLHDVSPVPGRPEPGAGEAELVIARLWQVLTDRWAPPSP
jgi:hypothetical protein